MRRCWCLIKICWKLFINTEAKSLKFLPQSCFCNCFVNPVEVCNNGIERVSYQDNRFLVITLFYSMPFCSLNFCQNNFLLIKNGLILNKKLNGLKETRQTNSCIFKWSQMREYHWTLKLQRLSLAYFKIQGFDWPGCLYLWNIENLSDGSFNPPLMCNYRMYIRTSVFEILISCFILKLRQKLKLFEMIFYSVC